MVQTITPEQVAATRKQFLDLEQTAVDILGPVPADLKESSIEIPLQDGFISRSIVIRPVTKSPHGEAAQKCPLIILVHGGSFAFCSPKMMLSPARAFASHFNAVVVSIAYKLAPENPFPAGPRSAWEVVSWLSDPKNLNEAVLKDESLEVDTQLGFILGGGSAGGNIAAVIAGINSAVVAGHQPELVEGLPEIASKITGLFIAIPYLMESEIIPPEWQSIFKSREENANAPVINTQSLKELADIYGQDVQSPWFSPLNLNLEKIKGYHPQKAYIQCGALDIIRDDAIIYEGILRKICLSETKLDNLIGYDHACWCDLPFDSSHSQEMKEKTMDAAAWLLGKEWDRTKPLPY